MSEPEIHQSSHARYLLRLIYRLHNHRSTNEQHQNISPGWLPCRARLFPAAPRAPSPPARLPSPGATEIIHWQPHRRRPQQRTMPYTWPTVPRATMVAQQAMAQAQVQTQPRPQPQVHMQRPSPASELHVKATLATWTGRGLCLARMHGSKPSERVHSHPQGGQLSGPNCKFVTHHANVECVLFLIIHFSWTHLMLILDTVCTKNN